MNQGQSTNIRLPFQRTRSSTMEESLGRNFGQCGRNRVFTEAGIPPLFQRGRLPRLHHPVPDEFAQVFPRDAREIYSGRRGRNWRSVEEAAAVNNEGFLIKQAAELKTDRLYITEMRSFFYTFRVGPMFRPCGSITIILLLLYISQFL